MGGRSSSVVGVRFEPIRRETVMDTVAGRIEQLVRSGELKSGDRLPPEPELARKLRVSRSSLREALKGLMYLGLIRSRAGDGTYIQSSLGRVLDQHFQWMILLNEVKPAEIYEFRKMLEPEVAALAASNASRADIKRLEAALDVMSRCETPEMFLEADIEFHEAFANASGNVAIQTILRMLYHATTEARRTVMPFVGDLATHWKRHERVYRSIRDRKPVQARAAVLDDLLFAEQLLRKHSRSVHSSEPAKSRRAKKTSPK
jgi:GntR family transcriptional regulator, transcriptional repressor for pyruvate dehydrogenase complex